MTTKTDYPAHHRHDLRQLRGDGRAQLKKLDGVRSAAVNLASERASVEFDPAQLHARRPDRARRAGRLWRGAGRGGAALHPAAWPTTTMPAGCEKALAALEGVTGALRSTSPPRPATVKYVPTLVTPGRSAPRHDGRRFRAAGGHRHGRGRRAGGPPTRNCPPAPFAAGRPALHRAAVRAVDDQRPGAQRGRPARFLPWLFHWPYLAWLFLALATPVQFYVGWQYYVGAYKACATAAPTWMC